MEAPFEVISSQPVGFNTKAGRVETVSWVLLDRTASARLTNTMDYQLDHRTDELTKFRDVKPGQVVTLGVTSWMAGMGQQGGRYRLQGRVISAK